MANARKSGGTAKGKGKGKYKLSIEPVPESSWFHDLSQILPSAEWNEIQEHVLAQAAGSCQICSARGELKVRASWDFDTRNRLQKLVGFVAVCPSCHQVRALDPSGPHDESGRMLSERARRHFAQVNRCAQAAFEEHRKEVRRVWRRRSRYNWQADLSYKLTLLKPAQDKTSARAPASSSSWLDNMVTNDRTIRERERREAGALEKAYVSMGLEDERKFYRRPAMRSWSRV